MAVSLLAAQSPPPNNLRVVAATGQPVPGVTGAVFGGSGSFDGVVVDGGGTIAFRGRFTGGGASALDDRALFQGSSAVDLQLVVRGGDPAPGIPGATLSSSSSQGLGPAVRTGENGSLMFGSALSGPGVTPADDAALFGGLLATGSLLPLVRKGDPAPGTAGASLGAPFQDLSLSATATDGSGGILFQSPTVGGDTTAANDAGWFAGHPGALALVQRRGDVVLGGAVVESLGASAQGNVHGQVLHQCVLSQTLGATPATPANDVAVFVWSPGIGDALLAREGDPAPGTAGATFNNPSNTWTPQTGLSTFNIFAQTVMVAELSNGDTVPGVNDVGLFTGDPGLFRLTARRGDPAPGTTSAFRGFVANTAALNDYRRCTNTGVAGSCPEIAFTGLLAGSGTTTGNDSGIWLGSLAGLSLVVREGDPAPGTAGAVFADLTASEILLNYRHQVVFHATLVGGDVGTHPGDQHALFSRDPYVGLQLVMRGGSPVDVGGGIVKQVASFATVANGNGEGRALAFDNEGDLAFTMTMTDGSEAVATLHVGSANVTTYGAGCAGITGVAPSVFGVGLPILGNYGFAIGITDGLPFSVGLIAASFAPANFPFGPCTILVAGPIVTLPTIFFDGTGTGTAPLAIPGDPSLVGTIVYGQGIALEPSGPFLGFSTLSNAISVELGN